MLEIEREEERERESVWRLFTSIRPVTLEMRTARCCARMVPRDARHGGNLASAMRCRMYSCAPEYEGGGFVDLCFCWEWEIIVTPKLDKGNCPIKRWHKLKITCCYAVHLYRAHFTLSEMFQCSILHNRISISLWIPVIITYLFDLFLLSGEFYYICNSISS